MKRLSISLVVILILTLSIVVFVAYRLGDSERVVAQGFVESRMLRLGSKLAGRIDRLYVEEGDSVVQGDTLYIISTPELDAKLLQVEAMLDGAKAIEEKAKVGTRKPLVASAYDMWQKAEVGVTYARQTYRRVARLCEQGVVSAQKRDEAFANLEAAKATARAAKSQYKLAVEGASREDKEAAMAQVQQAQSVVLEVERYLADRVVLSPVDGVVSSVVANAGEIVGSGYPVVVVAESGSALASFNMPETLLPQLPVGELVVASVPALGRSIEWRVKSVAVEADFATQSATSARGDVDIRTFEVKLEPLEGVALRDGMSVVVELQKPLKQ